MTKDILGLIADVNPNEISDHVKLGNLVNWCERWQEAALRSIKHDHKRLDEVAPCLDELDAQIIIKLADCGINTTEVSRQVFLNRSTVLYHINKIYDATDKNPKNVRDLCDLLPMAQRMLEGT